MKVNSTALCCHLSLLLALLGIPSVVEGATIISHYSFDTGDGFTDLGPGANHGAAIGGASISSMAGEFIIGDGALLLDGTGYVNIDALLGDLPNPTEDFSLAAWFRSESGGNKLLFSANKTSDGGGGGNNYLFGLDSDTQLLSHVGGSIGSSGVGPSGLDDGFWHFGVATYKASTSTHSLYVDGVLVGTANATVNWNTANTAQIGMERDGSTPSNYWNGSIDDLRIYSGELTAEEIGSLFNFATVPEPSSTALLGLSGLALMLRRRR